MQDRHPIAYENRKLSPVERGYLIYDKEMLAIMHALAKFRQYLVGSRFVVRTDHNSLRFFLGQKDLNDRQQRWVNKVQTYDFDIEYTRGKNNVVADALSRRPYLTTVLSSMSEISADWKAHILVEYSKNQFACEIMDGIIKDDRYKVVDDLIFYKDRIFLVPGSKMKDKILRAVHDTPLAGHPGYFKTYRYIRERFTWKGMKDDVLNHVRDCMENQDILRALKENLQKAQNQQKVYADRHRIERSFEAGDSVFLRLQPYRQSSLKQKGAKKLKPRFYGPYRVVRRVGAVAYELDLPEHSKIHNVFHVSCLKKALGQHIVPSTKLPPLDEEGKVVLEPDSIIEVRQRKLRNRDITKYLGGLIGLAAATVGLASEAAPHLEQIVPPVLNSFTDQDSRVRYYACEALYNIAKVARGDFILFFNQIFDALCKLSADSDADVQSAAARLLDPLVKDIVTDSDQFSIEEFIPLLRERMNDLNPYVRQFLVGWITVLDSVPEIDMLGFLPDFLDGLFNMLSDSNHEIRQQADSALTEFFQEIKNSPSVDYGRMAEILVQRAVSTDEFTRLTAITWMNEFVKLGGEQLVSYYADILGAILPCISDKEEKIRVVARETNDELREITPVPGEGFDIGSVLTIARRELSSEWEATRLEALHWMAVLLEKYRTEVISFLDDIFPALLQALSDPSDEVVLLVLEVHACIARELQHFRHLVVFLVHHFRMDNSLLENRGTLILRRLCVLLDAEKVYRELSTILEGEADLDFASVMVQALNLILLTSSELSVLRQLLKQSLSKNAGKDLFVALYSSWCHSPMATISLCLLAQAYQHASAVIQSLVEEDINVKFLVQLDKLVRLLETPIFTSLRLQLLDPGRYAWLLKALYGLLMLLPQQSAAFKILRTRLKTVPAYTFSSDFSNAIKRTGNGSSGIHFASKLQQFEHMQHQHRLHCKTQSQMSMHPRRPNASAPAQ
ncbi:hypothetical protein KI387_015434, partial [Taxus chinensis]